MKKYQKTIIIPLAALLSVVAIAAITVILLQSFAPASLKNGSSKNDGQNQSSQHNDYNVQTASPETLEQEATAAMNEGNLTLAIEKYELAKKEYSKQQNSETKIQEIDAAIGWLKVRQGTEKTAEPQKGPDSVLKSR